jgi:4-carboxymuconolactone decarboxylase
MERSDAYKRGEATRREIFGQEADARAQRWAKIDPGLVDFLMESVWGTILSRPGLDRRTRELLTLASLTSLGQLPELEMHVNGSLNVGVSKEEIVECIIQMAVYAGMPACLNALGVAEKVFKERGLME